MFSRSITMRRSPRTLLRRPADHAATIWLALTYVVLAQRRSGPSVAPARSSCRYAGRAVAAVALVAGRRRGRNAITFAICLPLLQRFRHVKMPLITRRWYDVPLRASLVATIVATVITLSARSAQLSAADRAVSSRRSPDDADPAPAHQRPATTAVIANGGSA